jgi:protease I
MIMAKTAIIVGDGFEDSEFQVPYERLMQAGHEIELIGLSPGAQVTGKQGKSTAQIDISAHGAYPDTYDALLIPGGYSPDRLRTDNDIVSFVQGFMNINRTVAAICHGPQLLIEADCIKGRTLTSWPSVKTDLINTGAIWIDKEVVIDGNLITSRCPDDLDAFCEAIEAALQHTREHHNRMRQNVINLIANIKDQLPHVRMDDDGFLQDADDWDETLALWLAYQEGMEVLNESHWQVIYALREYYQGHHHMPSFRQLCEAAHQTDYYCMERLFNNDGTKAWRIAGLPNPGEELKAYL